MRETFIFTLVELLIVIGIIGLLAGLLMPALQQARDSAKKIACVNNAKQIALGIMNYAGDNTSYAPSFVRLHNLDSTDRSLAVRCSSNSPGRLSYGDIYYSFPMGFLVTEGYVAAAVTDCPSRHRVVDDAYWGYSDYFMREVDGDKSIMSGYAMKICRWEDWKGKDKDGNDNSNSNATFPYRIGKKPDRAFVTEFSNDITEDDLSPDNPLDVVVHPKPYGVAAAREDGSAKFTAMPSNAPIHSSGTSDTFNEAFYYLRRGGEYTSE